MAIIDLEPEKLWKHFKNLLALPHCSGEEEPVKDYIVSFAKEHNLSYIVDKAGNVIITLPATGGYEKANGIILQAHIDMVCEKDRSKEKFFPIDAYVDGDWVKSKGTSLGADNGIGVAAILSILTEDFPHPQIEALFTVDEERGLIGALSLEKHALKGKYLLNLDSEEEGEFIIGCAGGGDSIIKKHIALFKEEGSEIQISIKGLRGGHSGMDINLGRGNAIKIVNTILVYLREKNATIFIEEINGGDKRNAIPREAEVKIIVKGLNEPEKHLNDIKNQLINAFKTREKLDISYSIEKNLNKQVLNEKDSNALINLINTLPSGPLSIIPDMDCLVETSSNLASIKMEQNSIEIVNSSRSMDTFFLKNIRNRIRIMAETYGFNVDEPEPYPSWKPEPDSFIVRHVTRVFKELFKKTPLVKAIHAGLEAGIFRKNFPSIEMVSFGPTIMHPHSTEEKVSISSTERFYKLLKEIIKKFNSSVKT